jgi:gas vesicle protein
MSDNNGAGIVKGIFFGFIAGFTAGAVTALLLTTKTGEELRSDIRKIAREVVDKVEEKAGNIKGITKSKYEEIVNNVVSTYKKLKDLTEKEIEFIKQIVDEQKNIAR